MAKWWPVKRDEKLIMRRNASHRERDALSREIADSKRIPNVGKYLPTFR